MNNIVTKIKQDIVDNAVSNMNLVLKAWTDTNENVERFSDAVDELFEQDYEFDVDLTLDEIDAVVAEGSLTYKDFMTFFYAMDKYMDYNI